MFLKRNMDLVKKHLISMDSYIISQDVKKVSKIVQILIFLVEGKRISS